MSYDENYESYLKSMGIPFFVVPIILGASESLTVEATSDPEGIWTLTTKNGKICTYILLVRSVAEPPPSISLADFLERESKFRLGEEFEMVWGRNSGVMHNVCTLKAVNVLK